MTFLIALLTLVMVLDCLILNLLVLIQLPKKEAGAGLAFGGSATDALFGAGSGNVLTKITKYSAGFFFAMAIIISFLYNIQHNRNASTFGAKLGQAPASSGPVPGPVTIPPATVPTSSIPAGSNPIVVPKTSAEAPTVPTLGVTNSAKTNPPPQ